MHLIDVRWASPVNRLTVKCNCGLSIDWPSNVSLVQCPRCRYAELWHDVDPKPKTGPWSAPVMENRVNAREVVRPDQPALAHNAGAQAGG